MTVIDELRSMPEIRRLTITYAVVAVLWIALLFAILKVSDLSRDIGGDLSAGDQIISSALVYHADPGGSSQAQTQTFTGDALSVISEIVSTLGMRERMTQLQSNMSGISLQFEKLYGDELKDFLTALDNRGLKVQNGEIRALPSGDDRLLNAALLVETK